MRKKLEQVAFRTSLLYWIVAVVAILLSDRLLGLAVEHHAGFKRLETYQDWAFVTVTALLLWVALRAQLRRWGREVAARKQAELAVQASEEKFSRAFRCSPIAMTITGLADHRILEANQAFEKLSGFSGDELTSLTREQLGLTMESTERLQQLELLGSDTPLKWEQESLLQTRSGAIRHVLLTTEVISLDGTACALTTALDITERKRAEALTDGNKQVLEMIACGAPLAETLTALCRVVEAQSPELLCSILLLDEEGTRLQHAAAPSLPPEYTNAINGANIGPSAGSCGTAAHRRERVLVADIASDPLWADYRQLALPHGLQACWSTPIFDEQQNLHGTFAIYLRRPGLPEAEHERLMELTTHTAAIAVSRHRTSQAMQHANRALRMLIDCNETLVRATDEKTLLDDICRIMVHQGSYQMAWVGYLNDPEAKSLRLLARAQFDPTQLNPSKSDDADLTRGNSPVPIASSINEQLILENILNPAAPVIRTDPVKTPGRETCCCLPLKSEGQTFGALIVWSSEPGAFGAKEMSLLAELADDLAFGVMALRMQSARDRAESELHLFRELMDRSTDAIFVVDPHTGRILDANDTACRERGYVRAKFLQLNIADIADVTPEHFRWEQFVEQAKTRNSLVFTNRDRRKDGTTFPVEISVRYVEQEDRPYLIYATRDITERKHAEAAIQQRLKLETQLSRLATTVPGVIHAFRLHPDGKMSFPYATKKIEDIYGLSVEALANDAGPSRELIHPDDLPRVLATLEESRRTMTPWWHEFRIRNPKRGEIWVEIHSVPEPESDGSILWHGFMQDITARKLAEARHKTLEAQLRQSQKMEAIGQLAAGVAHDFNNILTVIQSYATLLITTEADPKMVSESVQQISGAVKRAAGLTRQLLIFGRQQIIRPTSLDLNDIVSNMTKMLRRIVGEDVVLQADYTSNLPAIHGDAGMIEQIILNLAVNARDAMPVGGRLVISTGAGVVDKKQTRENPDAQPGPYVYLSVSDTGSGIAPENLPHIFEPFFTTKEVGKGTGLGLATVYGIVQQHHGWITLSSQVNQGTTFRICFPPFLGARPENSPPVENTKMAGGSETILVVEDEAPLRLILCTALERCGYRIYQAASGIAALEVWREHKDKIQLLLTDMVMPHGLNGHDLARRLTAEKPALKVIYCSGYVANHASQQLSLTEGVNFLQKPFNLQTLTQTVRDNLDRTPEVEKTLNVAG